MAKIHNERMLLLKENSTRQQGRHNREMSYCEKCKVPVRSLPRHNRRHHKLLTERNPKQQQDMHEMCRNCGCHLLNE